MFPTTLKTKFYSEVPVEFVGLPVINVQEKVREEGSWCMWLNVTWLKHHLICARFSLSSSIPWVNMEHIMGKARPRNLGLVLSIVICVASWCKIESHISRRRPKSSLIHYKTWEPPCSPHNHKNIHWHITKHRGATVASWVRGDCAG